MTPAGDKLDRLLARAIDQFGPKGSSMTEMQRLPSLAGSLRQRIANRVSEAEQRIQSAETRANEAVQQYENYAASVERDADDIVRELGQISNMPPPLPESGQS